MVTIDALGAMIVVLVAVVTSLIPYGLFHLITKFSHGNMILGGVGFMLLGFMNGVDGLSRRSAVVKYAFTVAALALIFGLFFPIWWVGIIVGGCMVVFFSIFG